MKSLKFFFIISAVVSFTVFACKKGELNNGNADITELSSQDDILVNDLDESDYIDTDLEERASSPPYITRVRPTNEADTVNPYTDERIKMKYCLVKNRGRMRLKTLTVNSFTIEGKGFGATQGSAKISATATLNKVPKTPITITVVSWSDSVIVATTAANAFADSTKNVTVKFILDSLASTKIVSGNPVTSYKTKTKSIKCTGMIGSDVLEQFITTEFWAEAGEVEWELGLQLKRLNKTNFTVLADSIRAAYVPQVGDLLFHESVDSQLFPPGNKINRGVAIVLSVTAPDAKGYRKVFVHERNTKCTGLLNKKTYKFKDGVFPLKTYENAYVTYMR